jgi:Transposase IS66 family
LKRWAAFARFLDDGRICRSNAAAERAVRGIVIGGPHADRDLRIKRRLSTGLARPNSREAAGSSREAARRMAAMELDSAPAGNRRSGLSHGGVDHPKIHAAPAG